MQRTPSRGRNAQHNEQVGYRVSFREAVSYKVASKLHSLRLGERIETTSPLDASGERLLKPIEVARWLNFGVDNIRKLVEEGGIPYIQLPGGRRNIRFSPTKIRAWLEEQSVMRGAGRKIGETGEIRIGTGPGPLAETDIVGHFRSRRAGRDQA